MNKTRRAGLIGENLEIAMDALWSHKLRSGLVILGVAIGVASFMGITSLLIGFRNSIIEEISSSEKTVLSIQKYDLMVGGIDQAMLHRKNITVEDAQAIDRNCPSLSYVAFIVEGQSQTIQYQTEKSRSVQIIGTQPSVFNIQALELEDGRMFTDAELGRGEKVVVISHSPRRDLFPNIDPIGKKIKIGNTDFSVIGTFAKRKTLISGMEENFAVIPYTAYKTTLWREWDSQSINAVVRPGISLEAATEEVIQTMRRQRRLKASQNNDFAVTSADAAIELITKITEPITLVLAAICSIALLVAGIGVMNIMLVSVAERTTEIGIRKAVGAERQDILYQFLIESGFLTGIGGATGVALGLCAALCISLWAGLPFSLAPLYILLSVAFSVVIGVFFGLYPALRASKLNPIKAISYAK
jgi:putative ABC transport system permease protein